MITHEMYLIWPSQHAERLSEHFLAKEFRCTNNMNEPWLIAKELVIKLELLREAIGKPIQIVSGYRNYPHNVAVGGASQSKHLIGLAADICVNGVMPNALATKAHAVGFRRIGRNATTIHVDVSEGEAYWIYTANGTKTVSLTDMLG